MKWLINPFERIAGWQALVIGFAVMVLIAVVSNLNGIFFNGVLYIQIGASFGFFALFAKQFVDFLILFLTMWIAGVCFSKSRLRAIDVAGTMALARAPMLLVVVICFLPVAPVSLYDIPRIIIFLLICIPFMIWMVALMYNAYTVSCHLKGNKAVVSFIGALVVAEIVSRVVTFFLLGGLFINSPATSISATTISTENTVVVADSSLTIRQKTENVVKAFERGDFNAITVYFDETMKKAISSSGLKKAWLDANMQFGKFEKADLDNLKETNADKYIIVVVPFYFKEEKAKLQLAFNSDGKISEMYFLPII